MAKNLHHFEGFYSLKNWMDRWMLAFFVTFWPKSKTKHEVKCLHFYESWTDWEKNRVPCSKIQDNMPKARMRCSGLWFSACRSIFSQLQVTKPTLKSIEVASKLKRAEKVVTSFHRSFIDFIFGCSLAIFLKWKSDLGQIEHDSASS